MAATGTLLGIHVSGGLAALSGTDLPSSVNIDQWASSSWTSGNNTGTYSEGDTIPFRLDAGGLTSGTTYVARVCRDFEDTGVFGYLTLKPFDTTVSQGTMGVSAPNTLGPFSASSNITLVNWQDTAAQGSCNANQIETDVTFQTDGGATAWLYWGGYLAAPLDSVPSPGSGTVAFQHSAGFYPGASLHMHLATPNKDLPINPKSIIKKAWVTVTKVVDSGSATPDSWCFTISPDNGQSPLCPASGQDTVTFANLDTGSYTVTEGSGPAGYSFASGSGTNCTFNGSTATATVAASTNPTVATCTFHNAFSPVKPSVSTTLKNASGDTTVANGASLPLGTSIYDTASVTNDGGLALTGTLTFELFNTGDCSGSVAHTTSGVAIGGHSDATGALGTGSYSFHAKYVAGNDANHVDSDWSSCEPFSVVKGTPTVTTTLKNVSGDGTVANGSTVALGTSIYDTASVSTDASQLTGTLTFEQFNNGDCSGTAAHTTSSVALNGHSDATGALGAGSYSFHAKYVAGNDPNHNDSDWSGCEPFSVGKGSTSVTTTLKNAAGGATVANGSTVTLGTSIYDTATVSKSDAYALTGSLTFEQFNSGDCTGAVAHTTSGVAIGGQSDATGALGAGSYSFHAKYVAGSDPNHADSDWSTCEPFSVGRGTPTVTTALKNAANDAAVANGSTVALGSSLYDTASVSTDASQLTGTLTFEFFHTGDCTGTVADTTSGVALNGHSDVTGALGAGSYSFHAKYVAGSDPNHNDSAWSTCEPFSVGKGTPTVTTTLKNAAGDTTVADGSTVDLGSSLYDTAAVTPGDAYDLTGTVTFQFFHNGTCTGDPASTQAGVAVGTASNATGALGAGSYGFRAMYVAGNDPNHANSAWSSCEPFSVGKGTPTVTTTLKNAAGDATVEDGSTLDLGSSVYDTADVSTDSSPLTGTVTFQFFQNGDCSGDPFDTQSGVAVGTASDPEGPLGAGSYGFRAMYVAGNDPNHANSDWSACEPFSVAKETPTLATTLKNASTNATIANGSALDYHSSVYDTAARTDNGTATLAGTVTFAFYGNGTCSGDPASTQSVPFGGHSNATGELGEGSYSFRAMYVAGEDPNNTDSPWSACEPFSVKAKPSSPPPATPPPPPAPKIDLAVTKVGSPNPTLLNTNVTWTIVVTNNGPNDATGVTLGDPIPAGTTFVSVATSQGSCTGGAVVNCDLGSLPVGEKATVTLITTAVATGTVTNTATAAGNEPETNAANNTASASVQVTGPFKPPVTYCTAVSVAPKQLYVGRSTLIRMRIVQHGKHVGGVRVQIKGKQLGIVVGRTKAGAVILRTADNTKGVTFTFLKKHNRWVVGYTRAHKGIVFTRPSLRNGVVTIRVYAQQPGIVTFAPIATKRCNAPRVGVTGVFTPPVTG